MEDQSQTSVSTLEAGGFESPHEKRKKRRLGNSVNSIQRLSAEHINHVWSWDFIFDRTVSGKQLKWLTVIDEFTRENLCLDVGFSFKSEDVIDRLAAIATERGLPKFIRSDNGPEFIASALRDWLANLEVGTNQAVHGRTLSQRASTVASETNSWRWKSLTISRQHNA